MRKVDRKNGKVYEGLTSKGIAHHIASSLRCFHDNNGTPNDCQLTINPLVRAYHVMIMKERQMPLPATPRARQAIFYKQRVIREHANPAHEVVCQLMDIDPSDEGFEAHVIKILDETFSVAWVVPDEHKMLNSRYMHSLPTTPGATFAELVALRYELCGVPRPTHENGEYEV